MESDRIRIVLAFLERVADDRAVGRERPLGEYLALYPGYEEEVESEFLALTEKRTSPGAAIRVTGARAIGPYVDCQEIGRGGQAVVYRARDPRLDRTVALKVLLGVAGAPGDRLARFRREAEVTSRLDHRGICPVYETGDHEGAPWIAMRYVEGRSLAKLIQPAAAAGPTTGLDFHVGLIEEVARALHAAHTSGVVHRDVKPGNIMVTPEGEPVVLDFGLAGLDEDEAPTLTRSGDLMGTPAYMAPEQIAGRRADIDRRTDVYSLGVTLYECATGHRPFDAPTREGLFRAILHEDAPSPDRFNPDVTTELRIVLATAMDKQPQRRYATAEAFADDLRRIRQHEPIAARPLPRWLRVCRWAQRNPFAATAGVGAFVLLGAVAAVLFMKNLELDDKNTALTRRSREMARQNREIMRLSDSRLARDLEQQADELWPAVPDEAPGMEQWLRDVEHLLARRPLHAARRAALEAEAHPYSEEDRRRDFAVEVEELAALELEAKRLEIRLDEVGEARAEAIEDRLDDVSERIDALAATTRGRRSWSFGSQALGWEHEVLVDLTARLDVLAAMREEMRERLAFARDLPRRTIGEHTGRWASVADRIRASDAYPGLARSGLAPQLGLVPLGPDPASGREEFLHLASHEGALPARDGQGRLVLGDGAGIILVLLPGGTFRMGTDGKENDPDADTSEMPAHSVTLDAFFIAKHEVTQGQWVNLAGENPSRYAPRPGSTSERTTWRNPVEMVTWDGCTRVLARADLRLPTEAQWEYAARAGTTTIRYCGSRVRDLTGHANLADEGSRRFFPPRWIIERGFFDGFGPPAPVGTFAPNPFGLHDVLGNVAELCRDAFGPYSIEPRPGDGLRNPPGALRRCARGGSFDLSAGHLRSARRAQIDPDNPGHNTGCRPARSVR